MHFYLKPFSSTMKYYGKIFLVLTFPFALANCTSFHQRIKNANLGMSKKLALKKFNEPHEKYRTKGLDHWVYESSKRANDKSQGFIKYKSTLIFDEGLLVENKLTRSFTNKELTEFYKVEL